MMPGASSGENQAPPGFDGKARLDARHTCVCREKGVGIVPRVVMVSGGRRKLVVLGTHNLDEKRDGHGVAWQADKVVSGRVVTWYGLSVRVIVCQPIGIDIMRLEETQAIGKQIHCVHKIGG